MPTTKDIFQTKKELRNWWARVIDDPNYGEVMLHARSLLLETAHTQEELDGARLYENLLTILAEGEPGPVEIPNPGLHHNIEQEPAHPSAQPPPKPQSVPTTPPKTTKPKKTK